MNTSQKLRATAQWSSESNKIAVDVDLVTFMEGKNHIVYCPSLDICGYGLNENEAKASFRETLNQYLTYTVQENTLDKDLASRGWKRKGNTMRAPSIATLIETNRELTRIFKRNFSKTSTAVEMPFAVCQ
jgi:hypothetical protein